MSKEADYYDLEIDLGTLTQNSGVEDFFYYKDVVNRKFFLNSEVSQDSVADMCRHILQINSDDKEIPAEERKPILIYVSTIGGYVDPGFQLIDVIANSITPVYTINLGGAYSMGFYIMLAGHKRYSLPNGKFMMHSGSTQIQGNSASVQDAIKFQERVDERIKEFVISRSKITPELYDKKFREEWSLFADEAQELGVVDYLIGKDCSMAEIV